MTLPKLSNLLPGVTIFFLTLTPVFAGTTDELAESLERFVEVCPEVEPDSEDGWLMKTANSCHALLMLKSETETGVEEEGILVDLYVLPDSEQALAVVDRITNRVKEQATGRIEDHSKAFEGPCFESWYEGDKEAWGTRFSFTIGHVAVLVTPSVRSGEMASLLAEYLQGSDKALAAKKDS